MAKTDEDLHEECMARFVELANKMKEEGVETRIVSAGLMTASAVYATYVAAGNDGGLAPSGVDKVAQAYRSQLEQVQKLKQARNESRAAEQ
jgi:Protein of unknown function (DUF3144)